MAKKHQHKISNKATRTAAHKSWRSDTNEALRTLAADRNYLDRAKSDASSTLKARKNAERNKQRGKAKALIQGVDAPNTLFEDMIPVTPENTGLRDPVMWASRMDGKTNRSKLVPGLLLKWVFGATNDALILIRNGDHYRQKRTRSVTLFKPSTPEDPVFDQLINDMPDNNLEVKFVQQTVTRPVQIISLERSKPAPSAFGDQLKQLLGSEENNVDTETISAGDRIWFKFYTQSLSAELTEHTAFGKVISDGGLLKVKIISGKDNSNYWKRRWVGVTLDINGALDQQEKG